MERLEEWGAVGRFGLECHPDSAVARGLELDRRIQPDGAGRNREVLAGTPEADEQMVIVRVDDRTPPAQIGKNRDAGRFGTELPGLGVMTGSSQNGVGDQDTMYVGRSRGPLRRP